MGNHAKQMQGIRLIGLGLQDLPVETLGLGKMTGTVVLHSKVQGLLDGSLLRTGRLARGLGHASLRLVVALGHRNSVFH